MRESNRLTGKVALVSGAARGLGAAMARRFVAEGARVAIADLRREPGEALASELGPHARFVALDVTREDDWVRAVDETSDAFGRLDILVNNAGIAEAAPLAEMTLDSYRRVIDVNQVGVFLGMRAVIAPMKAAGGGSIVNISSIDGLVGMDGILSYVASKFAVRGMTKSAARELAADGIRVNSVHPGFVPTQLAVEDEAALAATQALIAEHATKLAPLGRPGTPEEIAALVLFLASDESSYCTGSEFVADGGMLAGLPPPGS